MRMTTFGVLRSKLKRLKFLYTGKITSKKFSSSVIIVKNYYIRVLPEVRVLVDSVDTASHRRPLRHDVASDVGVLIQYSSHYAHWGKQPQALLDAVLEINKLLHIITERN